MTTSARTKSTEILKFEELARLARTAEIERARVVGELIATGIHRVASWIRGIFAINRRSYS